jgi:hypothetical protein
MIYGTQRIVVYLKDRDADFLLIQKSFICLNMSVRYT